MCLRAFGFACVLVVCGVAPSFGQQRQTGPRTLEGLLNSEDAQTPAASKEADAGPKRPAGTLVRPKEGVRHPDLDKAWTDYDASVAKVTESMKAAIAKQFDAATAKGDLDAAEKWQAALEKFEKAGEIPAEKEAKAAVGAAVADYKKAREELAKAYEAVVKSLTMEKMIKEAKAARDEWMGLAAGAAVPAKPNMWEQPKSVEAWQKAQGTILTVDARHGQSNPLATGITVQRGQMCWVAAHPEDKWNAGRGWPLSDFRGYMPLCIELGGTVAKVADGPVLASKPCELRLFTEDREAADNSGAIRVKVMIVEP